MIVMAVMQNCDYTLANLIFGHFALLLNQKLTWGAIVHFVFYIQEFLYVRSVDM